MLKPCNTYNTAPNETFFPLYRGLADVFAMNPLVLIPARMASTRLPGKPLADIGGLPMIVHVMHRAKEADVGDVVVATDTLAIEEAIEAHGGRAVMTKPDHPSGSDRIFEALEAVDPTARYDTIVNVQGDLPTLDAQAIRASLKPLQNPEVALATLATEIVDEAERTNPNVVKLVGTLVPAQVSAQASTQASSRASNQGSQTQGLSLQGARILRALYFTRATAPYGDGPLYHHIGLYAWSRRALQTFVSLPPSPLEQREKLEQLRALEHGMRIDAALVDTVPLGVDTQADLDTARRALAAQP